MPPKQTPNAPTMQTTPQSSDAGRPITGSSAVEGAAFPRTTKLLAGLLIGYLLYQSAQVVNSQHLTELSLYGQIFMVVALSVLCVMYYWIWVSRTGIDHAHIRQTWLIDKSVAIDQITQVKFIAIPHLEWLIAPRLVVQVRGRGSYVFHAADPHVLQAFARLSLGVMP